MHGASSFELPTLTRYKIFYLTLDSLRKIPKLFWVHCSQNFAGQL